MGNHLKSWPSDPIPPAAWLAEPKEMVAMLSGVLDGRWHMLFSAFLFEATPQGRSWWWAVAGRIDRHGTPGFTAAEILGATITLALRMHRDAKPKTPFHPFTQGVTTLLAERQAEMRASARQLNAIGAAILSAGRHGGAGYGADGGSVTAPTTTWAGERLPKQPRNSPAAPMHRAEVELAVMKWRDRMPNGEGELP